MREYQYVNIHHANPFRNGRKKNEMEESHE